MCVCVPRQAWKCAPVHVASGEPTVPFFWLETMEQPSAEEWELQPPSDNEEAGSDIWALATSESGGTLAEAVAEAAAARAAAAAAEEPAAAEELTDGGGGEEEEEEASWEAATDTTEAGAPGLEAEPEGTLASWSYSTVLGEDAVAAGAQVDDEWEIDDASTAGFLSDAYYGVRGGEPRQLRLLRVEPTRLSAWGAARRSTQAAPRPSAAVEAAGFASATAHAQGGGGESSGAPCAHSNPSVDLGTPSPRDRLTVAANRLVCLLWQAAREAPAVPPQRAPSCRRHRRRIVAPPRSRGRSTRSASASWLRFERVSRAAAAQVAAPF